MRIASLFSGGGGLDLGLERAGHQTVLGCEADRWARAVWRRHHPDVPICPDVEALDDRWLAWHPVPRVDVVAGGSPCTDLSVAGRRDGLAGDASRLFWHQCRVADLVGAPWVVWENVPDVLSSNDGEDFAAVLWGLCGHRPAVPADGWRSWGLCAGDDHLVVWRVLDAQWFGVAQRRRRLFAVRGPRAVAPRVVEVLLDAAGLSGSPEPRRPTGPDAPAEPAGGARVGGSVVASALTSAAGGADDNEAQGGHLVIGTPQTFAHQVSGTRTTAIHDTPGRARTLIAGQSLAVHAGSVVRRLTPVERERLMGWPDDWTAWGIDDDGARLEISDTQRRRITGNGVVAPVAEWFGRRLPISTDLCVPGV